LFVAGRSAEAAPAATLGYYGGPVISPHIKPFYWGVIGASDTNTLQTYLQHLADYMSGVNLAPGTEPVVRQYGVWGAIVDPPVIDTTPPSSTVTGPSIEAELNAKGVTFDPQTLVVVFTNTSRVPSTYGVPGGWCGFHSNFGTGKYYAHIPSPFLNCSPVGLQGTMKKWQLETSHEIFEAATDPLLNAWHTSAGGSTGEGADGDECNPTTYPSMAGIGVVTPFEDNKAALSNGGAAVCNLNAREQYTPINAVSRGPNLLDVFYEGQDHALWHKRFNGTGWEAAHSLNGQLAGAPAAVALDPNTLHVLVIGTTRYLHDMVWTNAGGWAADSSSATQRS
jgi:hypothetical protein